MIQHCPSCRKEYRSANKITIFGCCSHKTRKTVDGYLAKIEKPVSKRYEPPQAKPDTRADRPGDHVAKIIKHHFGIDPPKGCGCRRVQHEMNALGWSKCLDQIDRLANDLEANAKQFNWSVTLAASVRAVATGAILWLNPFDPWRSIIREACKRTKDDCDGEKEDGRHNWFGGV